MLLKTLGPSGKGSMSSVFSGTLPGSGEGVGTRADTSVSSDSGLPKAESWWVSHKRKTNPLQLVTHLESEQVSGIGQNKPICGDPNGQVRGARLDGRRRYRRATLFSGNEAISLLRRKSGVT